MRNYSGAALAAMLMRGERSARGRVLRRRAQGAEGELASLASPSRPTAGSLPTLLDPLRHGSAEPPATSRTARGLRPAGYATASPGHQERITRDPWTGRGRTAPDAAGAAEAGVSASLVDGRRSRRRPSR